MEGEKDLQREQLEEAREKIADSLLQLTDNQKITWSFPLFSDGYFARYKGNLIIVVTGEYPATLVVLSDEDEPKLKFRFGQYPKKGSFKKLIDVLDEREEREIRNVDEISYDECLKNAQEILENFK